VTSLEPRTPHQPGKLEKLSKNDYVFTLFIFGVNKKCGSVSAEFSIECRRFTGGCNKYGAVLRIVGIRTLRVAAIVAESLIERHEKVWEPLVKIAGKTALDAHSEAVSQRPGIFKLY
jgi:hypothetical protein